MNTDSLRYLRGRVAIGDFIVQVEGVPCWLCIGLMLYLCLDVTTSYI